MTRARAFSDAERFDRLRLFRSERVGPRSFARLIARFGSAAAALDALPGLPGAGAAAVATRDEIEAELEDIAAAGAELIFLGEPDYPALLARIHAPPPALTFRGRRECLRRSMVAIVGSRNASAAGLAFAEQIAREIGRAGHVVVSGLARGVDQRAHRATIESGTIAVFAGGLAEVYPSAHRDLLERILAEGGALSEMPFRWEARARDFPRRNRIVAGLSRAVVVVEAARRSGSLITAAFAADEGREIFAVPGSPLDPRAEGPNDLLRQGASLCARAQDVIEALERDDAAACEPASSPLRLGERREADASLWDELDDLQGDVLPDFLADRTPERRDAQDVARPAATPQNAPARPEAGRGAAREEARGDVAARVLGLLGLAPVSADELVRAADAPAREVRAILFRLELEGRLERHGADRVSLRAEP